MKIVLFAGSGAAWCSTWRFPWNAGLLPHEDGPSRHAWEVSRHGMNWEEDGWQNMHRIKQDDVTPACHQHRLRNLAKVLNQSEMTFMKHHTRASFPHRMGFCQPLFGLVALQTRNPSQYFLSRGLALPCSSSQQMSSQFVHDDATHILHTLSHYHTLYMRKLLYNDAHAMFETSELQCSPQP